MSDTQPASTSDVSHKPQALSFPRLPTDLVAILGNSLLGATVLCVDSGNLGDPVLAGFS